MLEAVRGTAEDDEDGRSFWLGGRRPADTPEWTWSDGTREEEEEEDSTLIISDLRWDWSGWLPGQPSLDNVDSEMCLKTRRIDNVTYW